MIWAGISALGKTSLAFIESAMDFTFYISVFENYLLPFDLFVHDDRFMFMNGNSAMHRVTTEQNWFEHVNVSDMQRQALSADLNQIKNGSRSRGICERQAILYSKRAAECYYGKQENTK